jgi:hypothetical protein
MNRGRYTYLQREAETLGDIPICKVFLIPTACHWIENGPSQSGPLA